MTDKNSLNIPALIAFVRRFQDYQGDKLKNLHNNYESIGAWVAEENINKGPYPVSGGTLHRMYESWCINKNYLKEQIAKNKQFHAIMKQSLHYKKIQKAVTYYINRKIDNDKKTKKETAQKKTS